MNKIAVLGSGLLGGSIALAVQKRVPTLSIYLWGRREGSVTEAHQCGIEHATSDMAEAVKDAELIILASPVGAMPEILQAAATTRSLNGVMVTDVGSVKLMPREALEGIITETGAKYIGSHPMAGSEQAGVGAARADLFADAACVMTNDYNHSEHDVSELQSFWEILGCHCHLTNSEDHDRIMARISHLPHLLASVGSLVGLKNAADGEFAGNGMRDTTRVASGHPGMWAEIFLSNREALKQPIEETVSYLREMLAMLDDSSEEEIIRFLQEAKERRDTLTPKLEVSSD